MPAVSSEAVARFQPLVHHFAARFKGVGNTEYDDLFQEGSIHVFLQLQKGKAPTGEGIKNAMRDWVRKEARRGFVHDSPTPA